MGTKTDADGHLQKLEQGKDPFRIHLVGCEKEIHFADAFGECGRLLARHECLCGLSTIFEITMVVRPDCVPPRLAGKLHCFERCLGQLPGCNMVIK